MGIASRESLEFRDPRSATTRISLSPFVPATWAGRTAIVVFVSTVFRTLVACTTGLTDTEAYYAGWARVPALSYYDHPPLVAWTTWLLARLGGSLSEATTVRLGPVLYATAFSILLYRLSSRLFSPRAGFFAVTIVTVIPVFFFTGFLLNPEALLAPLWTLTLLLLLDLREADAEAAQWWRPIVLGAVVGVAFLAKYTAVLAVPVILLYVSGSRDGRRWLRRPSFYVGGFVALAMTTPVLAWNALHGWPSLRLHLSERMEIGAGESLPHALWRVGSAQLVYFQPIILPALVVVLGYAAVHSRRDPRYWFLLAASLPVLGFLLTMMVRAADSEPHWTMMGYLPLAIGAGGLLDESTGSLRRVTHGVYWSALIVSVLGLSLYAVHAYSPALARNLVRDAAADPVNETLGWNRVRSAVQAHAARLGPTTVAAGAHNVLCGHLQAALDDAPPVYCPSPRRTEFDFTGRRSPPFDAPVVFVDSERYPADRTVAVPDHVCTAPEELEIDRSGIHAARYRLYECIPRREGRR
jgi:4-amino-4-deoxy-L-arabinose transferase-like glycosyltransferase